LPIKAQGKVLTSSHEVVGAMRAFVEDRFGQTGVIEEVRFL
jgi:hypothetical protein